MKKLFPLLLVLTVSVEAVGCGSTPAKNISDPAVSTTDGNNITSSAGEAAESSKKQGDATSGGGQSSSKQTGGSFDVNRNYAPKAELLNAKFSDGAFVQIGDTVLQLGVSTLRDFVNAGVDLGGIKQPKSKERNESLMEPGEGAVMLGTLGGEIYVHLGYAPHDGLSSGDTVIGEVSFAIEDIEANAMIPWTNGYSEYATDYINSGKVKDYYCLYFNGGVRFTGSSEEYYNVLGTPSHTNNPDNRGYQALVCQFTYPDKIPIVNCCQPYFGNNKCCQVTVWGKANN